MNHRILSVMVTALGAPYIGKGRWEMPHYLIHDNKFMEWVSKEVNGMECTMSERCTESCNTQTKFKNFKK